MSLGSQPQGILDAILGMPKQRFQDPKILQNKNGSFYIRPWVDVISQGGLTRQKKTIVLGTSKREATAKKAEVMRTINQGQYVVKSQISFGNVLVEYQNHIDKLGYATRRKYEQHIAKHIEPAFGNLKLVEMTAKVIQDWLDSKDLSWNTKTDLKNILSGVFTKAHQWGYWKEQNPLESVWVGRKITKREKRKLTIDQTRLLLQELAPMPRVVCMIGLFTTLRISEILGLQEKHLDFAESTIRVRQRFYRGDLDKTKTNKSTRDVSMSGLQEWLASLCIGSPEHFVIQSHQSCHSDENLRKRHLTPAAKRLGLYHEGFGFHALRREAITEIGKLIGVQAIMNMAGHTKMDLTMLYSLADTKAQHAGSIEYMRRVIQ